MSIKRTKNEITIYRCSCRACDKEFHGITQKEANAKHTEHIKTCKMIEAIEKFHRFWEKTEKILGRKLSHKEVCKLLGIKP